MNSPRATGLIAIVFLLLPAIAIAQAETVPAVPGSLSSQALQGAFWAFGADPAGAALHPGWGADLQVPVYSGRLSAAFRLPGASSALPFTANALFSGAHPLDFAVFSWSIEGLFPATDSSGLASYNGAAVRMGFSKRATDSLAIGIAFGAAWLDATVPQWSASGGISASLEFPELGAGGSTLVASLLGIGPGLSSSVNASLLTGLTPYLAFRTSLYKGESLDLDAACSLFSPSFDDVVMSAGLSLEIEPRFSLTLCSSLSIREPIPGISLLASFYGFGAKNGRTGFMLETGAQYQADGMLGAQLGIVTDAGHRDSMPPRVSIQLESPIASASRHPELPLGVSIDDAAGISGWELIVQGGSGQEIYRTGDRIVPSDAQSAVSRLLSVKRRLLVPKNLALPIAAWGDGYYRLRLQARDYYGNTAYSESLTLQVDSISPTAELSTSYPSLLSPDGDGAMDTVKIHQKTSSESHWVGSIQDSSGAVVRTLEWNDGPALDFEWDGRDTSGRVVADGTYSYTLSATDAANNTCATRLADLVVDTSPTPLNLSLSALSLSPFGASDFRTIRLSIHAERTRNLESWSIRVTDRNGKALRSWNGSTARLDTLPEQLLFDGRTPSGDPLPDGQYQFMVSLQYRHGAQPHAQSPLFRIDSSEPEGRVRASAQSFRLDAPDSLRLYHDLSARTRWTGIIYDAQDRELRHFPISDTPREERLEIAIEWNGLGDAGQALEEGFYRYQVRGVNDAGIVGTSNSIPLRLEKGTAEMYLLADRSIFSTSSVSASVTFLPRFSASRPLTSWQLRLEPEQGTGSVRTITGGSRLPVAIRWDGRDDQGIVANDGTYRATLLATLEQGRVIQSQPISITLDSTPPPKPVLTADHSVFSPNDDGRLDVITIRQAISGPVQAQDEWFGRIQDDKGNTIQEFRWKQQLPAQISWDGKDVAGGRYPDGTYIYTLQGSDGTENIVQAAPVSFLLDARKAQLSLSPDKKAFSPNGDGFADTLTLNLSASFIDGVEQWEIEIVDASGKRIRLLGSGKGDIALPRRIVWDGAGDPESRRSNDGTYRARATFRYLKGDIALATSDTFTLDATPPLAHIQLTPLPFSPDADGYNDELSISIRATDASDIAGWQLSILDPQGYPFTVFSGKEMPKEPIVWDGMDLDGNLVEAAQDYAWSLIVRDALGNTAKSSGSLSVDVFLLRDGDRLKIRISSIVFPPNASAFSSLDAAQIARNSQILDSIAATLKKFVSYQIRIEGHAVNLSGTETEERRQLEPLSLARAQTVLEELVKRGVDRSRLQAKGIGGREPLVSHADEQSRWRNRRVEFILMRSQ